MTQGVDSEFDTRPEREVFAFDLFAYVVSPRYACWDRDGGDRPPSHPYNPTTTL